MRTRGAVCRTNRPKKVLVNARPAKQHSRVLAIHESAHAVASIVCNLPVSGVHLRTRKELLDGDAIVDEYGVEFQGWGMVEGSPHIDTAFIRFLREEGHYLPINRDFAVIDMAVSFAGPIAEAQFSRKGEATVATRGGAGDYEIIQKIAALIPDGNQAAAEAWVMGHRLVRQYGDPITAVANLIQGRRFTLGEDVTSLVEAMLPEPISYDSVMALLSETRLR